jgi:uncharacterized membrane protein (DUF106 family)
MFFVYNLLFACIHPSIAPRPALRFSQRIHLRHPLLELVVLALLVGVSLGLRMLCLVDCLTLQRFKRQSTKLQR